MKKVRLLPVSSIRPESHGATGELIEERNDIYEVDLEGIGVVVLPKAFFGETTEAVNKVTKG